MIDQVLDIIKEEFHRRLIEESYARIEKCVSLLTVDEIWRKPNKNSNSIGNLILHLNGNVTQYVCAGIGGKKDIRERDLEFSYQEEQSKEALLNMTRECLNKANAIIQEKKPDKLARKVEVQGFQETVMSIIIHVIEHYSYHVGQITYFTKLIKDVDTGYYAGLNLNITN